MTLQRRIIPGSTYLATRRCSERRRFLNPCNAVNQAYLYCLGYAATTYGVDLHSFVVMRAPWASRLDAGVTRPNGFKFSGAARLV